MAADEKNKFPERQDNKNLHQNDRDDERSGQDTRTKNPDEYFNMNDDKSSVKRSEASVPTESQDADNYTRNNVPPTVSGEQSVNQYQNRSTDTAVDSRV